MHIFKHIAKLACQKVFQFTLLPATIVWESLFQRAYTSSGYCHFTPFFNNAIGEHLYLAVIVICIFLNYY